MPRRIITLYVETFDGEDCEGEDAGLQDVLDRLSVLEHAYYRGRTVRVERVVRVERFVDQGEDEGDEQ